MEGANLDTNKLNEQWFLESLKNQIANLATKQDIAVVQQKIDNVQQNINNVQQNINNVQDDIRREIDNVRQDLKGRINMFMWFVSIILSLMGAVFFAILRGLV